MSKRPRRRIRALPPLHNEVERLASQIAPALDAWQAEYVGKSTNGSHCQLVKWPAEVPADGGYVEPDPTEGNFHPPEQDPPEGWNKCLLECIPRIEPARDAYWDDMLEDIEAGVSPGCLFSMEIHEYRTTKSVSYTFQCYVVWQDVLYVLQGGVWSVVSKE